MDESLFNIEAEQAVLGSLLVNNDGYHKISNYLQPAHFGDPVHADIFRRIVVRIRKDQLASPITLKTDLALHDGLKELGGPPYLAKLAGASVSVFALPEYSKIVYGLHNRRKFLEMLTEAQDRITDGDEVEDVQGALEGQLAVAVDQTSEKPIVTLGEASIKALENVAAAYHGERVTLSTGIPSLDKKMGGLVPGDLILIGGRPSMGKTTLALSMALSAARTGAGVSINSLEMTDDALAIRALSEASGVPYFKARNGWLSEAEMKRFVENSQSLIDLPLMIIPPHITDIGAIYAMAKRAKSIFESKGQKLEAVFIDYLQLVRSQKQNRIDQITEISISLKGLAQNLNVPVVALSQLNRSVDGRDDKRPMLTDLRDSGQLEQDADVVLFCYREYAYLKNKKRADFKNRKGVVDDEQWADHEAALTATRNRMTIIGAKQRMGPGFELDVHCEIETNVIKDIPGQEGMEF